MTATQIVDKMNLNAGSVLSGSERSSLIDLLGVNPMIYQGEQRCYAE
jgi:hypothetical protein